MSTPKNLLTTTFLSLINDRDLCIDLTDAEMTEILDTYLKDSTYLRFKNCTKDLSDQEPFDFYNQTFTADGAVKTYTITQRPTLPHADAIIYTASVNGVDVGFTFDEDTLTFTLDDLPELGDEVICGYSFYGQFNVDLTEEEILILAWGMTISWKSKIVNNHNNMKNRISTKDYNSFSPANLLDKLILLEKEAKAEIKSQTVSYSFNDFEGFN